MNSSFIPTASLGVNKQCPVCKRMFIMYDFNTHAFKLKKNGHQIPVCSWGCLRSYEKKNIGNRESRRRELIEKQLQGIQEDY